MIGKKFREATKDTMGTRSAGGMRRDTNKWESSDNYDNFRQLFSTLKDMETASRTRNVLGERNFGDNLDNGQLLKGAPPNRTARGKWMGKREGGESGIESGGGMGILATFPVGGPSEGKICYVAARQSS